MFNKKIISYVIFTFIVISSCLFIIIVRENPVEIIKKDVLMTESKLSEGLVDIENIDDDLRFEDVEINTLINISMKHIENEYKIEVYNSNGKMYESIADIKQSIERTGIAKISWLINENEKSEYIYAVVINGFGEVLTSETIK